MEINKNCMKMNSNECLSTEFEILKLFKMVETSWNNAWGTTHKNKANIDWVEYKGSNKLQLEMSLNSQITKWMQ